MISVTTRVIAIAVSAVLLFGAAGASAAPAGTQARLQSYANQLQSAGAAGVLIDLRDDGDAIRARAGEAILGTNIAVPWGAHFRTGSTTKTFVSTVILQLVGEGKLSLDDSLEHWLPGVIQGNGYDGSQITVRQMLNHTSGIFDYTFDDDFFATLDTPQSFQANRFRTYTPEQLIDIALAHPPVFEPGTNWEYSNTNYVVAGEVIKAVTGKAWDVEVRQRIIKPLGLTGTSSPRTNPTLPIPFALGYHLYGNDDDVYTDTTLHNMSWAGSTGDMITTTKDENRFLRALMSGKLLRPTQLAEMKTIVPLGEGAGYGLGLVWLSLPCDERGFWSHDGGTVGYLTSNGVTDDGKRSIVASLSTTTFTDEQYAVDTSVLLADLLNEALCIGEDAATQAAPTVPDRQPLDRLRSF